jgi:hypothetical protein
MNMGFSYSNVGTKYFLELKGRSGRLYLNRLQFGNGEFELEIGGHKSTQVRSPLHFDIVWARDPQSKRLEEVLRDYHHPSGPGSWSIFPEVSVGAEYTRNGRQERTIIRRLLHCRVMRIQGRKNSGDSEYEIDFLRTG